MGRTDTSERREYHAEKAILFRNFIESFRELIPDDAERCKLYDAIFDYSLDGKEPEGLSKAANACFGMAKPSMDKTRNLARPNNRNAKGEHRQNADETPIERRLNADKTQVHSEEQELEHEQELEQPNNFKNWTEEQFKAKVAIYSEYIPYHSSFIAYWTEKDAKGRMRFQAEKFFEIGKRLATWASRSTSRNSYQQTQSQQHPQPKQMSIEQMMLEDEVNA